MWRKANAALGCSCWEWHNRAFWFQTVLQVSSKLTKMHLQAFAKWPRWPAALYSQLCTRFLDLNLSHKHALFNREGLKNGPNDITISGCFFTFCCNLIFLVPFLHNFWSPKPPPCFCKYYWHDNFDQKFAGSSKYWHPAPVPGVPSISKISIATDAVADQDVVTGGMC